MAYNFTKLSETPIVESTEVTPNILIEDDGDIKRISADDLTTPQVNADWNETDVTSPAFIMNKPTSLGGGAGANVVTYKLSYVDSSGSYVLGGIVYDSGSGGWANVSAQNIAEEWDNGSILRVYDDKDPNSPMVGQILGVSYGVDSGAISYANVCYLIDSEINNYILY